MFENLISIIRQLNNYQYSSGFIDATLNCLKEADIENINENADLINDFQNDNNIFSIDKLSTYKGKKIKFQIDVSNDKRFYDKFSSFLNKNKIESPNGIFYIKEIDYLHRDNIKCDNQKINSYFTNIKIIEILKGISNHQNKIGSNLELFFYKAESGGLELKINYDDDSLVSLKPTTLNELENHFSQSDKEERKQIFINEMIGLLKDNHSYSFLIKQWDILIENYNKSFKFYLKGFSFEKIKTSSISYFQEFTDRIFEQINKATINIFIVPSVYVLILKSFPPSDSNGILQSIVLLISMFIFSLVMHKVLFNNMKEGLNSIEEDINKFKEKASPIIDDLNKELTKLEQHIKKQYSKISMLKWANFILFMLFFIMFIDAQDSISYLMDLVKANCQISDKG